MKIIIVGGGKSGRTAIDSLVGEGHDVTIVEQSEPILNKITNLTDVMGVCGNGADCETLAEAGVADCDLFIAVMGSDEHNMLSCFLAKKMGAKHTIARIRNPEYNDRSLGFMKQKLELSMAINPDFLAAKEIFNILNLPSAIKIETFARRNFEMVEFRLKADSRLDGFSLRAMRETYSAKVLVCAVSRGDEIFIPDGNFVLKSGDKIGIMGEPAEIEKLFRQIGTMKKRAKNVMILGGSRTAFYLAKMLRQIGASVKIIEKKADKCETLAEELEGVGIIHGDGASQELLCEEGIGGQDAFVTLPGKDEENILISIFASKQNVPKVISKINRQQFLSLADGLGLDCFISPQNTVSDVVVRFARALQNSMGSNVETLYKIMDGQAEVLEFKVTTDSRLIETPLKELKLKKNIIIAGILRGRRRIVPGGDDVIFPGDRVIIFAANHILGDLDDILA